MPWARSAGEVVVIVVSVFVAIYLEGVAGDRADAEDAHRAMEQVLVELRADSTTVIEIRAHQVQLSAVYEDLLRWFGTPGTLPLDSVQPAIDVIATENRTLFPRRGAWQAMTSTGQLIWIEDQALVTRLAHFHESENARLEYNGRDYDTAVNEISRRTAPRTLDPVTNRRREPVSETVAQFRGQLRYLERSWNHYYIDLIEAYGSNLNRLISDVDAYLAGR